MEQVNFEKLVEESVQYSFEQAAQDYKIGEEMFFGCKAEDHHMNFGGLDPFAEILTVEIEGVTHEASLESFTVDTGEFTLEAIYKKTKG